MNNLQKTTSDEYEKGFITGHREMARTVKEWFATDFKSGSDNLIAFAKFIEGASREKSAGEKFK